MRATYNIKTEKKIKLEKSAIELSVKLGRPVKWTEIMEVMIDNFYKDACDIIYTKETEQK
jgi:hypothetical protein